jgi:hypothetical protein
MPTLLREFASADEDMRKIVLRCLCQAGLYCDDATPQCVPAPVGTYELTITSADAEPVSLQARVVARPTVGRIQACQEVEQRGFP